MKIQIEFKLLNYRDFEEFIEFLSETDGLANYKIIKAPKKWEEKLSL